MLQVIKSTLGYLSRYIVIGLLIFSNMTLYKKVQEKDLQLGNSINNVRQYESIISEIENDNRALKFTIDDFKTSKDSLINELDKTKKELSIKDKELSLAVSNVTVITDTIIGEVPAEDKNFFVELKPNELTTITISRKDELVECIPTIYNTQNLLVYNRKEYRNQNKKFFKRLFTLDFKKDNIQRYDITNSNDLIQTLDTRVIHIVE